jgi:anti-anti-sigma factor
MTTIQASDRSGVTVVRMTGDLTQDGVPQVDKQFAAAVDSAVAGGRGLVVDIEGVGLITTPGIAMLLTGHERARDAGAKLVFTGLRGAVGVVLLDRCRLDLVLTVAPNVDAAVKAVAS